MKDADFRAILANHAPLIAHVGTRIYPVNFPQAVEHPAVRYNKINGNIGLHMQGSDGLPDTLMQIDVRGTTALSVITVRDILVELLHAYRGTQGSTDFRIVYLNADRGLRHEKPNNVDLYIATLDFSILSRAAA